MTLSESKRSCPLTLWDAVMFLLVSSISCQHGSLHGADWGEKSAALAGCSQSPVIMGLPLPATFPQDALTACQRAIWHLKP